MGECPLFFGIFSYIFHGNRGKSRVKWVLSEPVDIFLLELGANDGLRGVPLTETRANLQAIIDMVHDKNPNTTIILAGMELPPNMGQDYTSKFRSIFSDLAKENDLNFFLFEVYFGYNVANWVRHILSEP